MYKELKLNLFFFSKTKKNQFLSTNYSMSNNFLTISLLCVKNGDRVVKYLTLPRSFQPGHIAETTFTHSEKWRP